LFLKGKEGRCHRLHGREEEEEEDALLLAPLCDTKEFLIALHAKSCLPMLLGIFLHHHQQQLGRRKEGNKEEQVQSRI
jgi:hypothetical protein